MSAAQFTEFLKKVLRLLVRHSAPGSLHYICMDWRHLLELLTAALGVYLELKNLCAWVKDNAGMGSLYRSQHELVLVFKSGAAPHRNNVQLGQYGRNRTNVWHYPSVSNFGRRGEEGNLLAWPQLLGSDLIVRGMDLRWGRQASPRMRQRVGSRADPRLLHSN